jgi:hypothetical protein
VKSLLGEHAHRRIEQLPAPVCRLLRQLRPA